MQNINGTVELIETTKSDVALDKIIGRNAFSLQKILDMEPDFLKVTLPDIRCHMPSASQNVGQDAYTSIAQHAP